VGDALVGIRAVDGSSLQRRLTALDYDATFEAIREVVASTDRIVVEANRVVKRAAVTVEYAVDGDPTSAGTLSALAGDNLRKLLLREDVKLYDPKTKRYDQPYARGDCAGEGICGTCLVAVEQGAAALSPKDATERLITQRRPLSWRAACRCVVGADNQDAVVRVRLRPQSAFADELDPGAGPLTVPEDGA